MNELENRKAYILMIPMQNSGGDKIMEMQNRLSPGIKDKDGGKRMRLGVGMGAERQVGVGYQGSTGGTLAVMELLSILTVVLYSSFSKRSYWGKTR